MNYSIQMAAKISNVGVHTIRIWERRYNAVTPPRDESGHRVYSKIDVEKLSLLNELCLIGFSISKIANLENDELKELLKEHGRDLDRILGHQLDKKLSDVDIEQSITITLMALKAYKLDIVSKELERLKNLLNGRQFALNVVLPLMSELGEAVASGDYAICHEHALSAIVKFHLGHFLYKTTQKKKQSNRTMIICGVAGDEHEFGILIAAALAQHYGIEFYYLGPNLPADSLIDASTFLDADMIVMGVTDMSFNLDNESLNSYVEKILAKTSKEIEIIFGCARDVLVNEKYGDRFSQLRSLIEFDGYLSHLEF